MRLTGSRASRSVVLDRLGHHADAARAVAVAQHEFRPRPLVLVPGGRRHRMAIDQHRGAEIAVQPREQPAQRAVIGLVQALDAAQRVVDRNALVVDFLGVADHPRDGAEPAGDPHRAGIGEGRQAAFEHARIELVGLAVDVDESSAENARASADSRADHAGDQFVDEAVLGAAQRRRYRAARRARKSRG